MTLSRWLRDYLYIPLGGNQKGKVRTFINLFITFLLAGLWHGAGWTFVIWGALHGVALVLHRVWRKTGMKMPVVVGWFFTFLFVNASWVIFRGTTMESGLRVLKGMCGMNGLSITTKFVDLFQGIDYLHKYLYEFSGGPVALPAQMYWYLLSFGLVVFLLPNSCQLGGLIRELDASRKLRDQPSYSLYSIGNTAIRSLSSFKPNCLWAIFSAVLFSMALYRLLKVAPTEFLYFNF